MRIMKARKRFKHHQLIAEVLAQPVTQTHIVADIRCVPAISFASGYSLLPGLMGCYFSFSFCFYLLLLLLVCAYVRACVVTCVLIL